MACVVGYSSYRFEEVEHAVPIRIVGPTGRQHRQLSRAASRRFQIAPSRADGVREVNGLLFALNAAETAIPGAAGIFARDVDGCREVQDAFVAALEIGTRPTVAKDGSRWLFPKGSLHRKVKVALMAMGGVTDLLVDECYGGQDPSKVDAALSRTGGAGGVLVSTPRGIRLDTDRRLRLTADGSAAPRCEDPRFFDRLLEGLRLTGASEAIEGLCRMARFGGGRFCQVSPITVYDLLCRPKAGKVGRHIPITNKGQRGRFPLKLIPGDEQFDWIWRYVDGERLRRTGYSLEKLQAMAADPNRRDALKLMPLFTEDGSTSIPYPRLYRAFRKAAERAGLWIDDDEYHETGRRRYVSFHWCRHEYVHRRLDAVAAMATDGERKAEKRAIKAYMGWSSDSMLRWYSAHHVVKLATRAAEVHANGCDRAIDGAAMPASAAFAPGAAEAYEVLEGLL